MRAAATLLLPAPHSCGLPSTAKDVLAEMEGQHPVVGHILEWRRLAVLHKRFLLTLVGDASGTGNSGGGAGGRGGQRGKKERLIHDDVPPVTVIQGSGAGGVVRIRGALLQTNSGTGRLAMEEPSLQTIPKPITFTRTLTPSSQPGSGSSSGTGSGGAGGRVVEESCNLRAAFVAPPGAVLVSVDYCQLELRLMAHFSGDPGLLAVLDPTSGQDPFTALAVQWLRLQPGQVGQELGGGGGQQQRGHVQAWLGHKNGPAQLLHLKVWQQCSHCGLKGLHGCCGGWFLCLAQPQPLAHHSTMSCPCTAQHSPSTAGCAHASTSITPPAAAHSK